jgi:hypothetical protein
MVNAEEGPDSDRLVRSFEPIMEAILVCYWVER